MMIRNFIQEPLRSVLTDFELPNFRKLMCALVAGIALSVDAPVSQAQTGLDVTQIQQQKLSPLQVTDYADYPVGQERSGTLRHVLASAKPGSRIVFSRPGTIHLTRPLDITVDGLTIDGTSNPVVIIGDVVRIKSSGCMLRHLWIFAADEIPDAKSPGKIGHSKGSDRDALVVWGPELGSGKAISDITIDHCWIGFGIDECFSTYGAVRKVVVKDSIIGFGLNRSIHPDDKKRADVPGHGKGVLIGIGAEDILLSGNILIHNFDRNIQVRSETQNVRFLNNVVYGWGRGNTFVAGDGKPRVGSSGQVLGNVYITGKASSPDSRIFKPGDAQTSAAYAVRGNIGPIKPSQLLKEARSMLNPDAALSQSDLKLGVVDAWQSYDSVLISSGPHPGIQDRLSLMVVEQIAKRTGDILDYTRTRANIMPPPGLCRVDCWDSGITGQFDAATRHNLEPFQKSE